MGKVEIKIFFFLLEKLHRCLEEGAEEFFLKPVRLSDVSKLKPHIMKNRSWHDNEGGPEKNEKHESPPSSSSLSSEYETSEENSLQILAQSQPHYDQTTQSSNNNSNNKRKSMDEGLSSPERTRPRYNDLTLVSN